jgi:CheY-like chemotaxis protein
LTSQESTIRKPKIAVIDDRPGRVNLALRVLAGARYRARAFTSPREALDVLSTTHFDVVLTDHRMGEHDASELCGALRSRLGEAAPPIVLLTRSVHDLAIRDRELFAGILIKPLSPRALLSALTQALRSPPSA